MLVDELPEIAQTVKTIMSEEGVREKEEYEEMQKTQNEMLKKRFTNNNTWGRSWGYKRR